MLPVLCAFWGEHHRLYEQSSSEVHTIFANEQMPQFPKYGHSMKYGEASVHYTNSVMFQIQMILYDNSSAFSNFTGNTFYVFKPI